MKITWIGQAGLLFETGGVTTLVDPYLSDSVKKVNPANYRRVPVEERLFDVRPDVLVCTHDHLDHFDPETVSRFLRGGGVCMLCPASVYEKARTYGGDNNYVLFNRHTEWTHGSIRFRAVKAEHSDLSAIGVIIEAEGKTCYITGDTLYNTEIFSDLPDKVDVLFLPINGVGNNMNMADAARFAARVGAAHTVPLHFGMFDALDPEQFCCPNRHIPVLYQPFPF